MIEKKQIEYFIFWLSNFFQPCCLQNRQSWQKFWRGCFRLKVLEYNDQSTIFLRLSSWVLIWASKLGNVKLGLFESYFQSMWSRYTRRKQQNSVFDKVSCRCGVSLVSYSVVLLCYATKDIEYSTYSTSIYATNNSLRT